MKYKKMGKKNCVTNKPKRQKCEQSKNFEIVCEFQEIITDRLL